MVVVAFVLVAGLVVGAVAYHGGIAVGAPVVLVGALTAAFFDAWGMLWRARHERLARVSPVRAARSWEDSPDGLASDIPRVLWLMACDTFGVSLVVIGLVGGLTYMVLMMLFWSGLFASH